jgi:integrase
VPIHQLSAAKIGKLLNNNSIGKYADGGGLYLRLRAGREPTWLFRYKQGGAERSLSLGPLADVDLGGARRAASAAREAIRSGRDPRRARASGGKTFDDCAKEFLAGYRVGLAGPKAAADWANSLAMYASPSFGALPVSAVDHQMILQALEPIWQRIPKTANLVRGRIEKVLEWATVKGHRSGDNPARWSLLSAVLPSPAKVRPVQHHAALPYAELPDFIAQLRKQCGIACRALEFVILTACRTGDVIGVAGVDDKPPLCWNHIDLLAREWLIPKSKNGAAHLIPLADRAVAILQDMRSLKLDSTVVFPSLDKPGQPMSHVAMRAVLKRMGHEDLTVHGFRANFKTWAGEKTNVDDRVVEAVLAHGRISDRLEAAYRRTTFFDKRRLLMARWADYCGRGEQQQTGAAVA